MRQYAAPRRAPEHRKRLLARRQTSRLPPTMAAVSFAPMPRSAAAEGPTSGLMPIASTCQLLRDSASRNVATLAAVSAHSTAFSSQQHEERRARRASRLA